MDVVAKLIYKVSKLTAVR